MAILQEQIDEGLAFIDTDARFHCGIVLNSEGKVTHTLHKPATKEIAVYLGERTVYDLALMNFMFEKPQITRTIGNCNVCITENLIRTENSHERPTLPEFLALWSLFEHDRATGASTVAFSADEFTNIMKETTPADRAEIDNLVLQRDDKEAWKKESAETIWGGIREIAKKPLFDPNLDTGLTKALFTALNQYYQSIPKSKIEPGK